jgi:hypothetical protein
VAERARDINVPHDEVGSIVSHPSARELPGTSVRRVTNSSSVRARKTPVLSSSTCIRCRA